MLLGVDWRLCWLSILKRIDNCLDWSMRRQSSTNLEKSVDEIRKEIQTCMPAWPGTTSAGPFCVIIMVPVCGGGVPLIV